MKKNMVRILSVMLLVVIFSAAVTIFAMAAPGGLPAAHNVDGGTFGGAVSELAQNDPDRLVKHIVSECVSP